MKGKFNFGNVVLRLRKASGLSIRELAKTSGLSAGLICHYEKGRNTPRPNTLPKLAAALTVPSELLSWFAYKRTAAPKCRYLRKHKKVWKDLLERADRGMKERLKALEQVLREERKERQKK